MGSAVAGGEAEGRQVQFGAVVAQRVRAGCKHTAPGEGFQHAGLGLKVSPRRQDVAAHLLVQRRVAGRGPQRKRVEHGEHGEFEAVGVCIDMV